MNNLGFGLQSTNSPDNMSTLIKKPPSAVEAIVGPSITRLGEAKIALDGLNVSDPLDTGDIKTLLENPENFINEATTRAICNGTSQLASILCSTYINSGSTGSILSFIEGDSQGVDLNVPCFSTRYGCCSDGVTPKLTIEGSNCGRFANDSRCNKSPFGCCPSGNIVIEKTNLIGTNCPDGAIPLIGWDASSTQLEKQLAGVGFKSTIANTPGFIPSTNTNKIDTSGNIIF